MKYIQPPKMFQ